MARYFSIVQSKLILIVLSFIVCILWVIWVKLNSTYKSHIPNPYPLHSLTEQTKFQQILDSFFVYTAYHDAISDPEIPTIRIIGIDLTERRNPTLKCFFYDNQENLSRVVDAEIYKTVDISNFRKYSVTFILCYMNPRENGPSFVSMSKNTTKSLILYPQSQNKEELYKVASCVQPFHSNFEKPYDLIEWIEYHKLLGVQHFTFYNISTGPLTLRVLENYKQDNLVTLVNFDNLPLQHHEVCWQCLAATDCNYRYRKMAKYVMTFDTDEYLVPVSHVEGGFSEYFDNIWNKEEDTCDNKITHLTFYSKLSFNNWPINKIPSAMNTTSGFKIITRTKFYSAYQTKFIARPTRIIKSGIHYPEILVNGSGRNVEKNEGYYLHFRNCDEYYQQPNEILGRNFTCLDTKRTHVDEYMATQIGSKLLQNVRAKLEELRRNKIFS